MDEPAEGNRIVCSPQDCLQVLPINTSLFIPFVISRLQSADDKTGADLLVRLRDTGQADETRWRVRVTWQTAETPPPFAVQGRVVTEWAACGLACAVLPLITGWRVLAVAYEGERFDYRAGNDFVEWGMEISGTLTEERGEIAARHRAKREQLLDNPHGMGGYVVIAAFSLRELLISYHQASGGQAE